MTTRAGFSGLVTGLAATLLLLYPLFFSWPKNPIHLGWVAVIITAILLTGGGALAAHWSGSTNPLHRAALGGLAGGLAGTIIFCLLGAAVAGLSSMELQQGQAEVLAAIIRQTHLAFLTSFLGGIALGSLGGWLTHPKRSVSPDRFDKSAPQMALNVAITAVPASIVATVAAAVVFSGLANIIEKQPGGASLSASILYFPVLVSLLLTLVSHFALTMVVPHEAQQAEHLCGLDEVKMAAYVAIGTAPALSILLLVLGPKVFTNPLVIASLLASAGLSLKSFKSLTGLILPKRASFPAPQGDRQKVEAKLFGTIANSRGPRLVVLCIGCGLVMILPIHVTVISVLINIKSLLAEPSFQQTFTTETAHKLFLTQALVSSGLMAAAAGILSAIYLFYLNLGRWFNQREKPY